MTVIVEKKALSYPGHSPGTMSWNLIPVPRWSQLPKYAQDELSRKNYDKAYFETKCADDAQRATILNLFVKMKGMNLWHHVKEPASIGAGTLEFLARDLKTLKSDLDVRWNFRSPSKSLEKWDSAEKRTTGALHFKHFESWETRKVQAHIDQAGIWFGSEKLWWLGGALLGLRHVDAYDSYQDVLGIRNILLEQGWDPTPLIGVGTTLPR